ncbi:ATP-binding cassette domain-containing protein [Dactylosporangium sp. NPDC049525]|uniref:ABC transporter ATP-binding protein n=1 Tax=Dactylosporangium sp. NPDC049525 TaxID=3154730 RepID=UPI003430AFC4
MITTRALTKRYGKFTAVNSVDLDVPEGSRFGLLGPNGSGKTTMIRMLLGLVFATSGEITLLDRPVPRRLHEVLTDVGALIEGPAFYGHLPGRVNLSLLDAAGRSVRASRHRRIEEALDRVGLAGIDRRPVRTYSLGMRQRLGLAAALLRTPRLLILDEPTNGLDPQGIHEIRELLHELSRAGTTLFLSSHLLAEVENLCDWVGIMDRGRLVRQDRLATMLAPTGRIVVYTPDVDAARAMLDGHIEVTAGERLTIRHADAASLNAQLVADGVRVFGLVQERSTLEEVVLAATSTGSDRVDAR